MRACNTKIFNKRSLSLGLLLSLFIFPILSPIFLLYKAKLPKIDEFSDDPPSDKLIDREEIRTHSDLIDGPYLREDSNSIDLNGSIYLALNDSSFCRTLEFNITEISETRDFITNGEFDNNIDNWELNDQNDVSLYWDTQNKTIELNITGIEGTHLLKPMGNWSGIEYFNSLINWSLSTNASSNFQRSRSFIYRKSTPSSMMHHYSGNKHIEANSSYSFIYNGSSLSSANLSIWYRRKIDTTPEIYSIEVRAYLVFPNKTSILLENWYDKDSNSPGSDFDDGAFLNKKFENLANYFNEQGNYTVVLCSRHNLTGASGMNSYAFFDDIELEINYTAKDINKSDSIGFFETVYYNRTTLNDGTLNFTYHVPEKFDHINQSFVNLSFWVNNQRYNVNSMDKIENDTWISESIDVNKAHINGYDLNITFGLFFDDSTSIYPNESFAIYFDNISFIIPAGSTPIQIALNLNSTADDQTYEFEQGANGIVLSLTKSSDYWRAGGNYQFDLITNTTGVQITIVLIATILTWRDVLIMESEEVSDLLNQTFISINNQMIDTMANISYEFESNSTFLDILDLVGKGDVSTARKKCTLISPTFEGFFNLVINSLETYFNQNNDPVPIENYTNVFSRMHDLFVSLTQKKDDLQQITERLTQELSALDTIQTEELAAFSTSLATFTSSVPAGYPINDILDLIDVIKQRIVDSVNFQKEIVTIPAILNSPQIGSVDLKIIPNNIFRVLALSEGDFPLLFQYLSSDAEPFFQIGYSSIPITYQDSLTSYSIKEMVLSELDKIPFTHIQILLDYYLCWYGNKYILNKLNQFLVDGISNSSKLSQLDKDIVCTFSDSTNFLQSGEIISQNVTVNKKNALQGTTEGVLTIKNEFFVQNDSTKITILNAICKKSVQIDQNSSISLEIPLFAQNSILNMYFFDALNNDKLEVLPVNLYQEMVHNGEQIYNYTGQIEINDEKGNYLYFPEEIFFNLSINSATITIEVPVIIGIINGANNVLNTTNVGIGFADSILFDPSLLEITQNIENKTIEGNFDYFKIKLTLPNLQTTYYKLNLSLNAFENGIKLSVNGIGINILITDVYTFEVKISSAIFIATLILAIIAISALFIVRLQQRFFIKNKKLVRKLESEVLKDIKSHKDTNKI